MTIVILGYRITIVVNSEINSALQVKLAEIGGRTVEGGSFAFELKQKGEDRFEIVASAPVVAAVLFKKPPASRRRGQTVPLTEWESLTLEKAVLSSLEQAQ